MLPGPGEMQEEEHQRIYASRHGYSKGIPDLVLPVANTEYNGFVIELKTSYGTGRPMPEQLACLEKFERQNYKVMLSNHFVQILLALKAYHDKIKLQCPRCENNIKRHYT